ncbi:leucine-rich repeat flightless-interacting protein 2-like isoform X2 [Daphnia pulex]|uniref:leucine-rich repeat flightless-interacting protein 2-like isoform X2 n=1 Tax=Daphnia pulex TaxID=6669 RepID=UPI001EDDC52A|nr:leucine-rich repeat flightless-interacting protein 2-like isoform X2 [Daphnia pulex]XP_046644510.1 leucine-rich repeat flightless-interacting protein 2-like isoform X2 [Daphnia pulicaria]
MDSVGNIGSRKRVAGNHYSAEEQALDQIAKEAESRLVARRLARAEARDIRMRELEKQQKEMEENADRQFTADSSMDINPKIPVSRTVSTGVPLAGNNRPILGSTGSFQSSRRGSEDSTDENPGQSMTLRDLRQELKELEEKFRKAMVQNAQSDNEKASLMYQVELFKDKIEDMDEAYALLQKEHKDKHRECEDSKREMMRIQQELNYNRYILEERDKMIQEHGLVIVGEDEDSDENTTTAVRKTPKKVLVSTDVASLLEKAGDGSLDVRIRRLTEEKNELCDQLRRVKLDLEEERTKSMYRDRPISSAPGLPNGPIGDLSEWQKEAVAKQVNDYKIKLQKADQEIATLQATVARLETQVTRFRVTAETLEKSEDELKVEKRKLQRELREVKQLLDETDTARRTLQRQYDKLKHGR